MADSTPRTVRYYIANGLLPAPLGSGPGRHYDERHLWRLRAIKQLQRGHLPLAAIRDQVADLGEDEIRQVASEPRPTPAASSALAYIRGVFPEEGANLHDDIGPSARTAAALKASSDVHDGARVGAQHLRSQWERIELVPEIELHIRRPLTRQRNRQLERLIAAAQQILKEGDS